MLMRIQKNDTSMTVSFQQEPGTKWIAGIFAFIAVVQLSFAIGTTFSGSARAADSGPFWFFGVLFAVLFARALHGWRTTLLLDRASGEGRVIRAPALVPPAERRFSLDSVARAETTSWLRHRYGSSEYAFTRFRLMGRDQRSVFELRLGAARQESVLRDVEAINGFLRVGLVDVEGK